jgi:hypothetical protein
MEGVIMGENKKKIKKKDLLRRIEDLEFKLDALRNKVSLADRHIQLPSIPDTLLTRPVSNCPQCGVEPGGTCMSVNCPYSVKITC